MNWMDLAVLIILAAELFRCFKQGMVKSVVEMAGWLVALIAAKLYYKQVATYLMLHFKPFQELEPKLLEALTKHMTESGSAQLNAVDPLAGGVLLPKIMKTMPSDSLNDLNQAMFGDLAHKIADMIINGSSFFIIVFAVMVVLSVATYVADVVMHLPLLKEVNRLGGLGVGLLKGVFSVWILMSVITFAMPFMKSDWLVKAITDSSYAIYFYNNNVLLYVIYFLLR